MVDPIIVYLNDSAEPVFVVPWLSYGLTVAQIAAKDVPERKAFLIVERADIPTDDAERAAWVSGLQFPQT